MEIPLIFKKMAMWGLCLFVLYAIVTTPATAAHMVGAVWDFVSTGVKNVFTFFDLLLTG